MGKNNNIKQSTSSINPKRISNNGVKKNSLKVKNEGKKVLNVTKKILSEENKISFVGNIIEKIKEAVKSHKEHASKSTKNSLFPDIDSALNLTFTLKKLAPNHQNCTKFLDLPFPERSSENTSVCLILPDIAKTKEVNTNTDTEIESREWSEILEEKFGIDKSLYSKIYTLRQLRREVKGFEAIKSFSRSYDVFMSASNVYKSAISHLGKNFLKANKALYPLCLKSHPKKKIENVVKKVAVKINPSKLNILTKIGNTSQKDEELVKNAEVILKAFLDNVPGGLENVRCIYLGNVCGIISLPVYISAGNPNDVKMPKPKVTVDCEAEEIGELNTIVNDNVIVGVTKSGKINFRNASTHELLSKKRKKTTEEEKDVVPKKSAKISNGILINKSKESKVKTCKIDIDTESSSVNVKEELSKKKKILKPKKLVKNSDSNNKDTLIKNSDKAVFSDNVESQGSSGVVNKKKIHKVDSQQISKAKNVVEKKNIVSNDNSVKVNNGKRELTPPTLRVSVKQNKKNVVSKTKENGSKVESPFKPISQAPKVFVVEGSSEIPITTKKINLTVKKKSNGSTKKNK